MTAAGSGRSDDANFVRLGVPAMHFFTGMHPEYTSPADQAYTVNPVGAAKLLDLLYAIAVDLVTRPDQLVFADPSADASATATPSRGYAPVRLGIRPGMGADLEYGVLVDEVYEGTSAGDGGIQAGDVMISWSGSPLESPRDLFQNLQQHEPGDQITITVLRDGVEVELPVTLKAGRPRE